MGERSTWAPERRMRWERELRGWTEDELAERMRRLAVHLGQPNPTIDGASVAASEAGMLVAPARLSLWCIVLDVPIAEVRALLDPMQLPEWVLLAAHIADRIGSAEMLRREFLRLAAAGGAMVAFDPTVFHEAVSVGIGRADRELLRDLAVYGHSVAAQTGHMPPTLQHAAATQLFETARTLLAGPLGHGLRRDLMAVAAHASALAGQTAHFLGRDDEARASLSRAGHLAQSAGHTGLEALTLLWTADTLSGVQAGREPAVEHRQVMALLDSAEDLGGPAAVRAHVLLRQAEEHAVAGDIAEGERYLDRADTAIDVAVDADSTRYSIPWSRSTHTAFRGSVAVLAGRPAEAVAILAGAIDHQPPEALSAITADMAAAEARGGNVDAAVELLGAAWEMANGFDDRRRRIVGIRHRDLSRWSDEPAVRRLDEQLKPSMGSA